MKRTKAEAELTRQNVIDSALIVFINKGFDNTTIEDIAKQAKVTRGAVYHYFSNKVELFKEIRRNNNRMMDSIIEKHINDGGKNLQSLKNVFYEFFDRFESDIEFKRIHELVFKTEITGVFRNNKEFGDEFKEDLKNSIKHIVDVVKFEQKEGTISSSAKPTQIAWMFIGSYFGIANLWLINDNLFSIKSKGKAIIEELILGITK